MIATNALYLVDSGGQYYDGTTDVTRTVCFDPPTAEEKEAYTLVLKGNLALHSLKWPDNTIGIQIDAFARKALWDVGLNYAHGTGHGVGSFLAVHEGPHGIGPRLPKLSAPLEANMISSNEPGFYKAGAFGIRIENLEVVTATTLKYNTMLGFDTLTVAPLCRPLIDVNLLTAQERSMVNAYHQWVCQTLRPRLEEKGDQLAVAYLLEHCSPV